MKLLARACLLSLRGQLRESHAQDAGTATNVNVTENAGQREGYRGPSGGELGMTAADLPPRPPPPVHASQTCCIQLPSAGRQGVLVSLGASGRLCQTKFKAWRSHVAALLLNRHLR